MHTQKSKPSIGPRILWVFFQVAKDFLACRCRVKVGFTLFRQTIAPAVRVTWVSSSFGYIMDLREVPIGTQHPPISILLISALTVFYNMPALPIVPIMCFKCNFIYLQVRYLARLCSGGGGKLFCRDLRIRWDRGFNSGLNQKINIK